MRKHIVGRYSENDAMSELICDNYPMLLVMSRFGINIGFAEETILQVCRKSSVDPYTFLAVVNTLISADKRNIKIDYEKISLQQLVKYLHNAHEYFLNYRLLEIRRSLSNAIDRDSDVAVVILNYFDQYAEQVRTHMEYEEQRLFPYINAVVRGEENSDFCIDIYSKHHDNIDEKLTELKNIIIKYYPAESTNQLISTLYDIFTCEKDLAQHSYIEDYLLVPTIERLEKNNRGK